jgi:hypothetical protein
MQSLKKLLSVCQSKNINGHESILNTYYQQASINIVLFFYILYVWHIALKQLPEQIIAHNTNLYVVHQFDG